MVLPTLPYAFYTIIILRGVTTQVRFFAVDEAMPITVNPADFLLLLSKVFNEDYLLYSIPQKSRFSITRSNYLPPTTSDMDQLPLTSPLPIVTRSKNVMYLGPSSFLPSCYLLTGHI